MLDQDNIKEENIEKNTEESLDENLSEENLEEVVPKEETMEADDHTDSLTEEENMEIFEDEDNSKEGWKKVSLIKLLQAYIIDCGVIAFLSVVALYIVDFILRIAGYFVVQKLNMISIIFVIMFVLYQSIMESSKTGNTIGKKLSDIRVINTK